MTPEVFQEFEKILSERKEKIGECVLEIGAVPTSDSLLTIKVLSSTSDRIGINLDGGASYKMRSAKLENEYRIVEANANNMTCFRDNLFDTVLCNSVLEHDKYFWKTISEICRVAKEGALIVIGAPGYDILSDVRLNTDKSKLRRFLIHKLRRIFRGTPTLHVHNWPGDYYRFSPQAFKEVIFEGMRDVEVYSVMIPPRVIGIGYNTK